MAQTRQTRSPQPAAATPVHGFVRKVLDRDDFGLCVLLPKTEWSRLPDSGPATVTVDGARRRVTVRVEACNCRRPGRHWPNRIHQTGSTRHPPPPPLPSGDSP